MERIINTHSNAACTHEFGLHRLLDKIDELFVMEETVPYISPEANTSDPNNAKSLDEFDALRSMQASKFSGDAYLVPRRNRDKTKLVLNFFHVISNKPILHAVGDKTPNLYSSQITKYIEKHSPNVKFIYMIRNPKFVIASSLRRLKKTREGLDNWHITNLEEAIIEWIVNWEHIARVFAIQSDKVLVVKYEDLVSNYEIEIMKIGSFLGLSNEFSPLSMSVPDHLIDFHLSEDDEKRIQNLLGNLVSCWDTYDSDDLLRSYPFIFVRDIEIGETLFANNRLIAQLALRDGFAPAEEWGSWTCEKQATVQFQLREQVGRGKVIIEIAHLNLLGREQLDFFVKCEHDDIKEFNIVLNSSQKLLRSYFCCTTMDGRVKFDILFPRPKQPNEEPTADMRSLGMALRSITPVMIVS